MTGFEKLKCPDCDSILREGTNGVRAYKCDCYGDHWNSWWETNTGWRKWNMEKREWEERNQSNPRRAFNPSLRIS